MAEKPEEQKAQETQEAQESQKAAKPEPAAQGEKTEKAAQPEKTERPAGLVPIKTSTGTGYCDCICGCYELVSLRDEVTGKGFCPRCGEQHLERNRELVRKMPKKEPSWKASPLPPGAKPPALAEYRRS